MYLATSGLLESALSAIKSDLDGGTIYLFAGSPPSGADLALDMVGTHTQVAALTIEDGGDGLVWDAPSGGMLSKPVDAVWEGLVAFDGVSSAETTLSPTFFRACSAGDTGRDSAPSLPRIQGSVGGPNSDADFRLTASSVTANGSNKVGASIANIRLSSG